MNSNSRTQPRAGSPWELRDQQEERQVAALSRGLTGLRSTRLCDLVDQIEDIALPDGIHTIRLHEVASGSHFASISNEIPGGLRASDIAISIALCGHYRWHRWVSTEVMPARQRGFLDLAIAFRRRIVPLLAQS